MNKMYHFGLLKKFDRITPYHLPEQRGRHDKQDFVSRTEVLLEIIVAIQ